MYHLDKKPSCTCIYSLQLSGGFYGILPKWPMFFVCGVFSFAGLFGLVSLQDTCGQFCVKSSEDVGLAVAFRLLKTVNS